MYNIRSEFIFPKQVIICDDDEYPDYKQKLIQCCYECFNEDPVGAHYTNVGGWQSHPKYFTEENHRMYFFTQKLEQIVKKSLDDQIELNNGINFRIDRWWINISGDRCYNTIHAHPECHYSGIFYVKSQENCGNLGFYQNIVQCIENIYIKNEFKDRCLSHSKLEYAPIEGRTILFPSSLPHDVSINNSSKDRISISFDLIFYSN